MFVILTVTRCKYLLALDAETVRLSPVLDLRLHKEFTQRENDKFHVEFGVHIVEGEPDSWAFSPLLATSLSCAFLLFQSAIILYAYTSSPIRLKRNVRN